MPEQDTVFLRKASGLVRSVSTKDVFFYNTGIMNLGIGLSTMLLYWGFYPGASLWIAIVVTAFFCVIQTLTYFCYVCIMPRTGGEYIYISRTLTPLIGLIGSFMFVFWTLNYAGFAANLFPTQGLQSIFADLGSRYDSETLMSWSNWVTTKSGAYLIDVLLIICVVVIVSLGMKVYMRVQSVIIIVGFVGIATLAVVLAFTSSVLRR